MSISSNSIFNPGYFNEALKNALSERLNEIKNEEIEKCVSNIRTRINQHIGAIACSLASQYRVECNGMDLRITVKNYIPQPPNNSGDGSEEHF